MSVTEKHAGLVEGEFEGLDEGSGNGLDEAWWFDTDDARVTIKNEYDWDGNNNVSRTSGDQFDHETLYVTAKGRYALHLTSQWQGRPDRVTELDVKQVVNWLIKNETDPCDYKEMPKEVTEEFERRQG
jgi:hypothetical protein